MYSSYLIDSVGNAIAVGIPGTAQDAIIGGGCGTRVVLVGRLVNHGIRIVDVVGTVDGTIAQINSVEHPVQVAVDGTADAIDDDDTVDVVGRANDIIRVCWLAFDPVAVDPLVRVGGILVGVGTAVAQVDRIGHKVAIDVGAAEDGQPLIPVGFRESGGGDIVEASLELPGVLEDITSGVGRTVIEVVGHTVQIEIRAAVRRREVAGAGWVLKADGSVDKGAPIVAIGDAVPVGIGGVAGGIVAGVGTSGVACATPGVFVDGIGGTDVLLDVPDAAGALVEDVGNAVSVCE